MIVCICKNISEDRLREVMKQGHRGEEALKRLGVGSDCGICLLGAMSKLEAEVGTVLPKEKKST